MAVNPQLNPSFRYVANIPQDAAHPTVIAALNDHSAAVVDLQQAIAALAPKINANATTTIIRTAGSGGSRGPIPSPSPSSYPNLGFVNNQSGVTAYTLQQTDAGAIIELSDASPIAIDLNSLLTTPFFCIINNLGVGIATLTPSTGTINGTSSITLSQNQSAIVAFDSVNWWAASIPIQPISLPTVTHEFLTSYDSTTGLFTQAQPVFSDISGTATASQVPPLSGLSGQITSAQLPSGGQSVTIVTAALTVGGTQGSQTFVNGQLTAQVQAT